MALETTFDDVLNNAASEDHLHLDEDFIAKCLNATAVVDPQNKELQDYSSMPFFAKLSKDKQDRYIKEFQVKQLLNKYSEGKKPPAMSDRKWKMVIKQKFQYLTRDEYKKYNQNKKRKQQERKRESKRQKIEPVDKNKAEIRTEKTKNNIKLIIDCSFDDLMLPKEIKSMTTQVTRIYNCNRTSDCQFNEIAVSCFNKRLKERFDKDLTNYTKWSDQGRITFEMKDLVEEQRAENMIYLSADADDELDDFDEGKQYIIGGIVDKGRYKNLCHDKAKKLNIQTARLPINEYIKLHGNKVLTSLHVVQLINEFLANGKDWAAAFEKIMPRRKVIEETT